MRGLFVRSRTRREVSPSARRVGAFLGTVPGCLDRVDAMERWLDRSLDAQTLFEAWDSRPDEIAAQFDRLTAVWEAGRVPLLTWEPFTPTPAATPDDVVTRALAGEYDDYFEAWTSALAEWIAGPDGDLGTDDDRRLYLRPMHEANGDWYPWAPAGGSLSPAEYVRLWRRLHRLVSETGVADNVAWVWTVNHVDTGETTAEDLFPGDDVVDLLGVDGFNWGASQSWSVWQEPEGVFGAMFERVRAISARPLCVPEFGSTSATVAGTDAARKGAWLRAAFDYFADQGVMLAAYFDVEKETDWQVFGGSQGHNTINIGGTRYQTYPGFRTGSRRFVGDV